VEIRMVPAVDKQAWWRIDRQTGVGLRRAIPGGWDGSGTPSLSPNRRQTNAKRLTSWCRPQNVPERVDVRSQLSGKTAIGD